MIVAFRFLQADWCISSKRCRSNCILSPLRRQDNVETEPELKWLDLFVNFTHAITRVHRNIHWSSSMHVFQMSLNNFFRLTLAKEERTKQCDSDNDYYKLQPIKSHLEQINLVHHLSFDTSAFYLFEMSPEERKKTHTHAQLVIAWMSSFWKKIVGLCVCVFFPSLSLSSVTTWCIW